MYLQIFDSTGTDDELFSKLVFQYNYKIRSCLIYDYLPQLSLKIRPNKPLQYLNNTLILNDGLGHQKHSFLGLGLSWKFQPNPSWLNFCLICCAPPPPFLPKIEFWLRGGKIFHSQSHSFLDLGISWKFQPNPSWMKFCLIWGASPPFFCLKSSFG